MSDEPSPRKDPVEFDLDRMLMRALVKSLILGGVASVILLIASGWRDASMVAAGAGISAASIYEWRRLARLLNSRFDRAQKISSSVAPVALWFVVRLTIFAGVLYGSLKCLRGSPWALLGGLALAVLTLGWESLQLLRE